MTTDRIINAWDLVKALDTPYIAVESHWFSLRWRENGVDKVHVYRKRTGPSLYGDRSNEKITHGSWAESVAAAKRRFGLDPDDWRPVIGRNGTGYWFPGAAVERAPAGLRWSGSTTSAIRFGEPGRPCTALISGGVYSHACGRPAAIVDDGATGLGTEDGVAYRCRMHEAGHQRSLANAAAREAEWEARDAARRHRDESERACTDVIERIRPLLAELGVHAATIVVGEDVDNRGRVGVLIPAEVAEMLTSRAIEHEEITSGMAP
jgi:hypothetical protein